MPEEASRVWGEIVDDEGLWDRKQLELEALQQLRKEDLLELHSTHLSSAGAQRARLAIHLQGQASTVEEDAELLPEQREVPDLALLKQECRATYPWPAVTV